MFTFWPFPVLLMRLKQRVGRMPLVGARGTGMPEPFEIVDPLERFVAAREEAVSAGIDTARQGRQIRPNQALWLAGAAIVAISTLILVKQTAYGLMSNRPLHLTLLLRRWLYRPLPTDRDVGRNFSR